MCIRDSFWLYNKIGKQEELTKAIASMAAGNGWISDRTAYIRDLPALEDVIDESNIHGWLQDQIHDAETRYADLIQTVLTTHPERLEEISKVAFRYGRRNGRDAEKATDVFRIFEDFFVNGMPCDRVNAVVTESDDEVSWQMTQDIHAQYWKDVYKRQALRRAQCVRPRRNRIYRRIVERRGPGGKGISNSFSAVPVSYTHLDVYKRQDDAFVAQNLETWKA